MARRSKSSRRSSGSADSCALCRRRPMTQLRLCPCRVPASRRFASIGKGSSLSALRPGRTGRITGSSSRPGGEPRWSLTTFDGAGTLSASRSARPGPIPRPQAHRRDAATRPRRPASYRAGYCRPLGHRGHDDDLRTCLAGREAESTAQARRGPGLTRLPSRLPSNAHSEESAEASGLLTSGGQGRGRAADLPLFRRIAGSTRIHCRPADQADVPSASFGVHGQRQPSTAVVSSALAGSELIMDLRFRGGGSNQGCRRRSKTQYEIGRTSAELTRATTTTGHPSLLRSVQVGRR